jgi:cleavage stimulation factor subunit 3
VCRNLTTTYEKDINSMLKAKLSNNDTTSLIFIEQCRVALETFLNELNVSFGSDGDFNEFININNNNQNQIEMTESKKEIMKRIIDDFSKSFLNTKRLAREYDNIIRPLVDSPFKTTIYDNNIDTSPHTDKQFRHLIAWKRYLIWEKQNPFYLNEYHSFLHRIKKIYFEKVFPIVGSNFEIFYEAAYFFEKQLTSLLKTPNNNSELINEIKETITEIYQKCINDDRLKNNCIIYLAYAQFEEEIQSNTKKCQEIYEKCLQNSEINEPTLVWIHYIRFIRRRDGVAAARKLFKRARTEDSRVSYHLYIANAYLEYYCTKDKGCEIGVKILQMIGAPKFGNDPDYMLACIKYMSHLNEDNPFRVLFEKILSNDEFPASRVNEIWLEFLKFECQVGDLASILKVDKKRQKMSAESDPINDNITISMVDRYKYLDLLPCTTAELKSLGYKDLNPLATSDNTFFNHFKGLLTTAMKDDTGTTETVDEMNEKQTELNLASLAAIAARKNKFKTPDPNQMIPFKPIKSHVMTLPVTNSSGLVESITGGIFPFPPAATELVKLLPPPNMFEVNVITFSFKFSCSLPIRI